MMPGESLVAQSAVKATRDGNLTWRWEENNTGWPNLLAVACSAEVDKVACEGRLLPNGVSNGNLVVAPGLLVEGSSYAFRFVVHEATDMLTTWSEAKTELSVKRLGCCCLR